MSPALELHSSSQLLLSHCCSGFSRKKEISIEESVSMALISIASAILSLIFLYRFIDDKNVIFGASRDVQHGTSSRRLLLIDNSTNTSGFPNKAQVEESCDIFSGSWVRDDSYPLYGSQQNCPYLSSEFNCKANGRPDSEYLNWRWQPTGCTIPRFNSSEMLEMLRGKRLMFVGDSLSRNQWESMICMLQSSIPDSEKTASLGYPLATFMALNYNASVDLFWAPFLVDLENRYFGSDIKRILRIDSIENNANYWKGADILVFNSAHWWQHTSNLRGWDYIELGNNLYQDMDPMLAYGNGMATWANWIDFNINSLQTQVIFTSMSPAQSSDMCYSDTEPIQSNELSTFPAQMGVLESILVQMTVPVEYMNITTLSDYRRDAHPSIYGSLSQQQRSDPLHYADCSHWCVSGVPDIWNELLFSILRIPS